MIFKRGTGQRDPISSRFPFMILSSVHPRPIALPHDRAHSHALLGLQPHLFLSHLFFFYFYFHCFSPRSPCQILRRPFKVCANDRWFLIINYQSFDFTHLCFLTTIGSLFVPPKLPYQELKLKHCSFSMRNQTIQGLKTTRKPFLVSVEQDIIPRTSDTIRRRLLREQHLKIQTCFVKFL